LSFRGVRLGVARAFGPFRYFLGFLGVGLGLVG
jgi:hypothetical protein